MKQDIENIIRTNLPEKKDGSLKIPQGNPIDGYSSKTEREKGFNQALSQIDTSLIADEVLKVVVEKIKDDIQKYLLEKHIHFEKEDNLDFVEEKPYIDSLEFEKWLLQLLSNLSPNRENKKI